MILTSLTVCSRVCLWRSHCLPWFLFKGLSLFVVSPQSPLGGWKSKGNVDFWLHFGESRVNKNSQSALSSCSFEFKGCLFFVVENEDSTKTTSSVPSWAACRQCSLPLLPEELSWSVKKASCKPVAKWGYRAGTVNCHFFHNPQYLLVWWHTYTQSRIFWH